MVIFPQRRDQFYRTVGIIGIVTIDNQIDVRVNISELAPNNIAFAFQRNMTNLGTGSACDGSGLILGIIIKNVDDCLRQSTTKISNDFRNRYGLRCNMELIQRHVEMRQIG